MPPVFAPPAHREPGRVRSAVRRSKGARRDVRERCILGANFPCRGLVSGPPETHVRATTTASAKPSMPRRPPGNPVPGKGSAKGQAHVLMGRSPTIGLDQDSTSLIHGLAV